MDNNTQEQRRAPRISINRSAKIAFQENEFPAKLLDISIVGSGILCSQAFNEDDNVIITFSLPNYDSDSPLQIQSRVARVANVQRQYLVGLEFEPLDLHQNLVIKDFISYHNRFQD